MSDEDLFDALDSLPDPAQDPTAALLAGVLAREADAVRPSPDGLARIRAAIEAETGSAGGNVRRLVGLPGRGRTAAPRRHRRSWGTALIAAAAVVLLAGLGAFALQRFPVFQKQNPVAGQNDDKNKKGGTDKALVTPTDPQALPVYVVGSLHDGAGRVRYRLFRESHQTLLTDVDQRMSSALTEAVGRAPLDPDYERVFGRAGGGVVRARWDAAKGEIDVILTQAMATNRGATDDQAAIAVQQIVWTATATLGRADVPVLITVANGGDQHMFGRPGFPLGGPVYRSDGASDPRAPLWIVDPGDADVWSWRRPRPVEVQVGFEARDGVAWTLTRNGKKVDSGVATVGFDGGPDAARPGVRGSATIPIDYSKPGDYEITVTQVGSAPAPHWSDTKTFTVN